MNPLDSTPGVITHKWILVRGLVIAVVYGAVAFAVYLGLKYSYAGHELDAIFESFVFPFGRRIVFYSCYDADLNYFYGWSDNGWFLAYCAFWSVLVGIIASYAFNRFEEAAMGKRLATIACVSVFLMGCGYVSYDWSHVRINLSLLNVHQLRSDCENLIERQHMMTSNALLLKAGELPASFTIIGAKEAAAVHGSVFIKLEGDWNGASWGIMYDPPAFYKTISYPSEVYDTWYRDFYEYLIRGE